MKLGRPLVLTVLFCACMAAIATAGAVEELKRPQPVWLLLAAMACAAAGVLPGRPRAWTPELCAMAVAACAVSTGRLAVAVSGLPGLGDVALRPVAVPVLVFGAAALGSRPIDSNTTGLWRYAFLGAGAVVTAGLGAGFVLISRYHDLEVSTFRDALFNVALAVAAYLTARPFLGRSGEERFRSLLVGMTAFSMLAAGLVGRYA
ncbi:MAG TPA: hypothetical protein VMZ06_00085 [Candidatus Bathyarchaeia archaeon]|nr:hypothetical protein [Candidatus Bathyarchaeia archaeon]